MRLIYLGMLLFGIRLNAQNLPVFRPADKKIFNTQKSEMDQVGRSQQQYTLHFVAPFNEWWGSTFMELTNRDGQPSKAEYPPTYESFIVNKKLTMSSWDKYHTYIEQAQENVVDGTKDFQINIITEWGGINEGLVPNKGKRPGWETKKEDHIDEKLFYGIDVYTNPIQRTGYRFGISTEGVFKISKLLESGERSDLKEPTSSTLILRGGVNLLRTERKRGILNFYINDSKKEVFSISADGFTKMLGFALFVDGNQTISCKKFEVNGFRN